MTGPVEAVWIDGIGVLAPGLVGWPSTRSILRGEIDYAYQPTQLPAPTLLPSAERRRASRIIKLALGIGLEAVGHAGADASTLATVFTASGADGHNCHALCEQLATADRQISPTRFHNSVHNAAAGYWSIATQSMAPCQVICAFDGSFGAGLLEAVAQVVVSQKPAMLVAYDGEYPEPLHAKRSLPDCGGVAWLLSPMRSSKSQAGVTVQLTNEPARYQDEPALETLRKDIPAMRALPVLERIARKQAGSVVIEYLAPAQIQVDVAPC